MTCELDKWADAQPTLHAIRDFLDWCEQQKIELAEWLPHGHRMMPRAEDRERMLARYLEIDEAKLERERRALLAQSGDQRGST